MKKPLTIARIQAAKVPAGAVELKLWDSTVGGLCLRVFTGGGRTWVYRYRSDGGGRSAKLRTYRLGSFPALSIDAARVAARAHAGQVAKGQDPAQERQEARRREKAELGMLLAINGPYERHLRARHIVKTDQVLSRLRRGLARFSYTDVSKLTRRDFVEAIDALGNKPGAQIELRKCTCALLEWAVNGGLAPYNALAGWQAPQQSRTQKLKAEARRRALTDSHIVAVWHAAEHFVPYGTLVRLALLTGLRRNELATLRWSDIHDDRIVIRAEIAKTATAHSIPLTPTMRDVIGKRRSTSPLLFPSNATGRVISNWHNARAQLMRDADVGQFTLHDLRRTCRTLMTKLGVAEPIAELAIGHAKESLVALYDHDERWTGRCDAFNRVSEHIAKIILRPN